MTNDHNQWIFPPLRPPHEHEPLDDEKSDVDDGSRPVGQYDEPLEDDEKFVDKHRKPVGQVRWNEDIEGDDPDHVVLEQYEGAPECSGTLIGENLFLTAGHSFVIHGGPPPTEVAQQMHVLFNYLEDTNDDSRGDRVEVKGLVEHVFQYAGLDYALLELEGELGSEFGTATVAWGDANDGDELWIISHPNGKPMHFETGTATHFHDVRIGYDDINTAPGSSGAGILKSDGCLVGIHTQGGREGRRRGHNHGIAISAVLAASPRVREQVSVEYRYESHRATFESYLTMGEPEYDKQGDGSDGKTSGGSEQAG